MLDNKISSRPIENSFSVLAPAKQDYDFPCALKHLKSFRNLDLLIRSVIYPEQPPMKWLADSATQILSHTPEMGRAGFLPIFFSEGSQVFGGILVKSTGMPRNINSNLNPDFPLNVPFRISSGSPYAIDGAASRGSAILDAQRSLELSQLNVPTRLPLAGYFQSHILIDGQWLDVDKLVKVGAIADEARPYATLWAVETPFRYSDLVLAVQTEDAETIEQFAIEARRYMLQQSDFLEICSESQTKTPLENVIAFMLTRFNHTNQAMYKANVNHTNLHPQNICLHGKLQDNSSTVIGEKKLDNPINDSSALVNRSGEGIEWLVKKLVEKKLLTNIDYISAELNKLLEPNFNADTN